MAKKMGMENLKREQREWSFLRALFEFKTDGFTFFTFRQF